MPRALIVGDSCGALAALRELGRAGWSVGVASQRRLGWASTSRWNQHWHYAPSVNPDTEAFLEAINSATRMRGYEIAFGASDETVFALSAHRDRVLLKVPYATHSLVTQAFDKLALVERSRDVGLAAPRTLEANETTVESLGFPVVIKSRFHWKPAGPPRVPARIVNNPADALEAVHRVRMAGQNPLVQEYLSSPMLVYVAVVDQGQSVIAQYALLVTRFGHSESGSFARAHTVFVDPNLAARIHALLKELRWFGLVNLQFLFRDGEPAIIDFNGRMFGSLAMASACGLNAHDTWARLATGQEIRRPEIVIGSRYHSMEADFRQAFARSGVATAGALLECLTYAPRAVHPILSISDPKPTLAYSARLLKRVMRLAAGLGRQRTS